MQYVSQAWKDEQKKHLISAEAFVEITLNIGDPEAQASAVVSHNGEMSFSNAQEITNRTASPLKYATMEAGLWLLDGTCRILGSPLEPPLPEGNAFIPAGESTVMRTVDGEEFYVRE